MNERENLLASIAATSADYRAGELTAPTPAHVDKWIRQFRNEVQVPILKELDYVLKQTYLTKVSVTKFFGTLIANKKLAGSDPCAYWSNANILNIQKNGHSQKEIVKLFGEALKTQCKLSLKDCKGSRDFVYLDDVLFTGGRVGTDLKGWIAGPAPEAATVHIVVIAAHTLGEWQCIEGLKKAAEAAKKKIEFHCWALLRPENRKSYRDKSEVLWPASIPADAAVKAYVDAEKKFPFEPRTAGGKLALPVFSSEEGRQLLEREFLVVGVRIRGFSKDPKPIVRPLGFSPFGLGFGSTIVTYRNCPNNCPLALWWGDPSQPKSHPLSKWYPLFPRKTYD